MTLEPRKVAKEPEVLFPPMLPTSHMTVSGISGWWSILKTKPRCEKQVAVDLLEQGMGYFVPLVKRRDKHRNVIYAPLDFLRGFVFVATSDEPPSGYQIPGSIVDFVAQNPHCYPNGFIPVRGSQQRTLSHELQCIFSEIVKNKICVDVNPNITLGSRCEVIAGPFMGEVGYIDELGNGWAMLPVTTLGRRVPTQIPLEQLERV